MKVANGRPNGKFSGLRSEPSHSILVTGDDNCGAVTKCYSSVIELGIVVEFGRAESLIFDSTWHTGLAEQPR